MNILAEQADASATLESRDRRRSLSTTKQQALQDLLKSDSYLFAKQICKHRDLVDNIHMPVSYLACGLTDRLIECLDMPQLDSYVTRKLRHELFRRQIDWHTKAGRNELDDLINGTVVHPAIVSIRMSRRFFKSSVITHAATLFLATVDPNETIRITHAVDLKSWEFCEQIGKTVLSGVYRDHFPDRIPDGDLSRLITQKRITLGGRTISHPQTNIQAYGRETKDEAAHYSTFVNDDIVTEEVASQPESLRATLKWMKGLTGFYMPTRRIRRLEVGTKHDEDDDDTMLCKMPPQECLTLRVPIEEHKGRITNILERGTPTCPELFPSEKITAEQSHVLSGEEDEDGYRTWWNQYLLSATGGTLRLFNPEIVDDPDRWWMGPFQHPVEAWHRKGRYLIARFMRDKQGRPYPKHGKKIYDAQGELLADWRENAEVLSFDPWEELDRVTLVDPSWSDNSESDNWGVSTVGQDVDNVRMQLETSSDITGLEGWVTALIAHCEKWNPRVWGIDATAAQDPFIENVLNTDKRLRRLRGRMIKLHHTKTAKAMRLQEGVAQPLMAYQFLLAPPFRDSQGVDQFGGNMTRNELKAIKSTPKHAVRTDQDGIADSLAMSGAVIRTARRIQPKQPDHRRAIDPYLGIPIDRAYPLKR